MKKLEAVNQRTDNIWPKKRKRNKTLHRKFKNWEQKYDYKSGMHVHLIGVSWGLTVLVPLLTPVVLNDTKYRIPGWPHPHFSGFKWLFVYTQIKWGCPRVIHEIKTTDIHSFKRRKLKSAVNIYIFLFEFYEEVIKKVIGATSFWFIVVKPAIIQTSTSTRSCLLCLLCSIMLFTWRLGWLRLQCAMIRSWLGIIKWWIFMVKKVKVV